MIQSLDMPGDEETEVVAEKPKRAPRKRTPKATAPTVGEEASAAVPRAPRKRAPRKKVEAETAPVVRESVVEEVAPRRSSKVSPRKAPTPIATERAGRRTAKRQAIVVAVLLVLGVGSSAAVGFTDKGRIDINQLITERNRKIESGELHESIIPVQNTSQVPDGGLIPLGDAAAPQVNGMASSSASSTAATATSTATSTPEGNIPTPPEEIGAVVQEEAPALPAPQ